MTVTPFVHTCNQVSRLVRLGTTQYVQQIYVHRDFPPRPDRGCLSPTSRTRQPELIYIHARRTGHYPQNCLGDILRGQHVLG
ncbi:MAG: hypothetical protein K6T27_09520, partial [Thermoleophilum sp.]|nr:hypothetical protein [Thermoleophilum sp.]